MSSPSPKVKEDIVINYLDHFVQIPDSYFRHAGRLAIEEFNDCVCAVNAHLCPDSDTYGDYTGFTYLIDRINALAYAGHVEGSASLKEKMRRDVTTAQIKYRLAMISGLNEQTVDLVDLENEDDNDVDVELMYQFTAGTKELLHGKDCYPPVYREFEEKRGKFGARVQHEFPTVF